MKTNLVLIHGWGFNRHIWQSLQSQLAADFNPIAIDLPGYGHNTLSLKPYSLSKLVESVLMNTPPQAIYCGWSLGATVAMAIAHSAPERTQALVSICGTPCFLNKPNWDGIDESIINNFAASLQNGIPETLTHFFNAQFHQSTFDTHTQQRILEPVMHAPAPCADALAGGLTLLRETDLRDHLTQLICPQFYVYGRLDNLIPATNAPILAKQENAHTDIIDQAAHIPFLTHPTRVIDVLLQAKNCSQF